MKILALPAIVILLPAVAFCNFVLAISGAILNTLSVIVFLFVLFMTITHRMSDVIVQMIGTFLISPMDQPQFAEWLVEKVDDINCLLKDFVWSKINDYSGRSGSWKTVLIAFVLEEVSR